MTARDRVALDGVALDGVALDGATLDRLAEGALAAVAEAGTAILEVYAREDVGMRTKADDSPVTEADLAAHRILARALAALEPALPVLSEEDEPETATRLGWPALWIVDPLDGTREFLARNGEFTVNVALVADGRPVLGVVGVPARGEAFVGVVPGGRAERVDFADGSRSALVPRPCPAAPAVMASRSHRSADLEALLGELAEAFPGLAEQEAGSALKLVELARGACDGYPRRGPCSEWDIAAGEAVLRAAGGELRRFDGARLTYNKAASLLNPDFWAVGDPDGALAHWFARRGLDDAGTRRGDGATS
jgi:3'(2'), 5'-bisphosphate nucleotidase